MGQTFALRVFYIALAAFAAGALYWYQSGPLLSIPELSIVPSREGDALFVGDVMLSRHVETHMRREGMDYPFSGVTDVFSNYGHVIGNLEGPAPERHEKTPTRAMRFSIDTELLPSLKRAGFTLLTLANNHTLDYGVSGYEHTKTSLEDIGLLAAGHPGEIGSEHTAVITVGDVRVGVVPIHAVSQPVDVALAKEVIAEVAETSDLQVVTVHWGEEYDTTGNARERLLARALIDAGADAIIGHHPHVVQNVELYKDAPIFYSLGNFVFDQYWNDAVETGLAVALRARGPFVTYELLPLRSDNSVPRFLEGEEKRQALLAIAKESGKEIAPDIRLGSLTVTVPLATSSIAAMIGG